MDLAVRVVVRWKRHPRSRAVTRRPSPQRPLGRSRSFRFPKISARALAYLGVALLATLFVHDLFGDRGYFAMKRTQRQAEKLSQEIQKIDAENRALAEQVKSLKTDPDLIERIARDEMGYARPGELIFKLPPRGTDRPPGPQK